MPARFQPHVLSLPQAYSPSFSLIALLPRQLDLNADLSAEEIQMMQAMGIPFGFDTTKNKHVEDDYANLSGIKTKTTRSARQYMNRRGGFNRPLPAEVTDVKVARD
jgi:U4/U6.U5 tri-snRNP-associated protein 3